MPWKQLLQYNLAGTQYKVHVGMCIQQRLKSVFAYTQSDESPSFPPEET